MSRNDPLMFDWTLIDQQKCANKCPSINFCCFRPVWFERPEKCLPCNTQSNMTIIDFINSQNATVEGASFWQWLPFWHILGLLMATLFFGISLVGSILICRKVCDFFRKIQSNFQFLAATNWAHASQWKSNASHSKCWKSTRKRKLILKRDYWRKIRENFFHSFYIDF